MKLITVLTIFLLISACATGEKVKEVAPGMTEQQVISVMGKPDSFRQNGEYTLYKYTNRLISGWSWDRTDYTFIFGEQTH